MQKSLTAILLILLSFAPVMNAVAEGSGKFYPAALVQLDEFFSHHILVAEKSTHLLHLFQNSGGRPELIKSYQMATGKMAGDKIFQGDHRTPEGIYLIESFIPHEELIKKHGKEGEIYGVGSFVLDYPNPIDRRQGKTGGGIWLHSTNDETRIEKGLDSRGCVVTANNDLKDISKYIELFHTRIVIVHDLKYLSETTWETNRKNLEATILDWKEAWRNEDFARYISFYHPTEFNDNIRGNFRSFSEYKKAVFQNPGTPEVDFQDLSLLVVDNYAVATFKQIYKSNSINDAGVKTVYLKKDQFYNWKIVSENWGKLETSEKQVAFRPSMRFFEPEDENRKGKN